MLAYHLEKAGKKVIVADPELAITPSAIAAGIMNPVTGRRLVKSWMAEELFAYAHTIYPEMEKFLGTSFYRACNIYKVFGNQKTWNDWLKKARQPEMKPFLPEEKPVTLDSSQFHNPYGSLLISEAGRVDIKKLVLCYRNYLKSKNRFFKESVREKDLQFGDNYVKWKGIEARKLLVSTGYFLREFPYLQDLPLRPSKGETLYFRASLPEEDIINKGVHILPLGNGFFKAGATNEWHYNSEHPSQQGRDFLIDKIDRLIKVPRTIIAHKSGIRPSTFDRKPLIGVHPDHPQTGIFTGLGSKGATLAPWFAQKFVNHLLFDEDIPSEASVARAFADPQEKSAG